METNYIILFRFIGLLVNLFIYIYNFLDNFKLTPDNVANNNPFRIVVLRDINAKSAKCYENDKTYKGAKLHFDLQ